MAGAKATELPMHGPNAVLLVRDEALRETIATIVGELSRMLVTVVDNVDAARRATNDCPSAVLIVAPSWRDNAVAALLRELAGTAVVVVSASQEHAALAMHDAVFVRAPFDVDTLLGAIEEALGMQRPSRTQPIAH